MSTVDPWACADPHADRLVCMRGHLDAEWGICPLRACRQTNDPIQQIMRRAQVKAAAIRADGTP